MKVGDRVKLTGGYAGTRGRTGEVIEIHPPNYQYDKTRYRVAIGNHQEPVRFEDEIEWLQGI